MTTRHIYTPLGRTQPAPEPEQPAPTLKELEDAALAAHREVIAALDEAPHYSTDVTEWEAARARFRRTSAAYIAAAEAWSEAQLAAMRSQTTGG